MTGPLAGIRVVELSGIGPGPHAAMLLADMGADVVRVNPPPHRSRQLQADGADWLQRGRRHIVADLKTDAGLRDVLALTDLADVLIEGFRPGVAERLGIGPQECGKRNPALIYARMTGWGQQGPLAKRAGHDINYISQTGMLHAIGPSGGPPAVPLNLVGDFGGGSTYLVIGVLAALHERTRSGLGQVIDAAIVDGVSSLAQMIWSMRGQGNWTDAPADNLLDGGAPYYGIYRCSDGGYVAVGALEPQFYAELLVGLNLAAAELPDRDDKANWAALRSRFAAVFATRTRAEWTQAFIGTDACVTPVLSLAEAARSPQLAFRRSVMELGGTLQAAPAPRFSRSIAAPSAPPPAVPTAAAAIAADWARAASAELPVRPEPPDRLREPRDHVGGLDGQPVPRPGSVGGGDRPCLAE
jgi:alpha-methylacyl-CoA racemase